MGDEFPMNIKQVHVKSLRCLLEERLDCDALTALVGPNGAGKSTFLRALELFYAANPKVTVEDFYNRDTTQAIEVTVTFGDLGPGALKRFAAYLDKGRLTVTRVISWLDGKPTSRLHGNRLQVPAFRPTREAPSKSVARRLYNGLREHPEYADLPIVLSADAALAALEEWEAQHSKSCSWQRDQGQFFGFKEVGQGYLGDLTHLIVVPAVRDAAEESSEGRGSAITDLMDLVVRSTLAASAELKKFTEEAKKRYEEVVAGEAAKRQLASLETGLGRTLKTYVPTAGVKIDWVTEGGVTVALPRADVKLMEDAYPSPVDRTGHGLQRAFILTMLQYLAAVRTADGTSGGAGGSNEPEAQAEQGAPEAGPGPLASLIIAIEEPELYQHPSRQRHFANVLLRLSSGAVPEVAATTQIIYATHSPLFVGIDRFDQTRLMRKVSNGDGKPRIARVARSDMDSVAEALWVACDKKDRAGNDIPKFTGDLLQPRLQCLMTPWMSESFFAEVVVLVEGEGDRAAILGAAVAKDHDFESMGITVIPCGGKPSMDRPALILRAFGIPIYIVWDGDEHDEDGIRSNRILQRIVGVDPIDYPSCIEATFACFHTKLEKTLREELGPDYDKELDNCKREFGYTERRQAEKNPRVLTEVIRRTAANGKTSASLDAIVEHILELYMKEIAGVQ